VIEEHDSMSGVISSVEAGNGIALGTDVFSHTFGHRVKLVHLTPEPEPFAIGIAAPKGKLPSAAETFCQCASEAFDGR
jgi:DNA-binding transcriptional LysR family regulator